MKAKKTTPERRAKQRHATPRVPPHLPGAAEVEKLVRLAATRAAATAATEAMGIVVSLVAASGNVGAAAVASGVPRRTFDRQITAYGLRGWLSKHFPRAARQPPRSTNHG